MFPAVGLIVDTETTGLSEDDEVIELALVLFGYDPATGRITQLIGRYEGLREPSVPTGGEALQVHGITEEMTRGKALDGDRVRDFFSRADLVFAHNADFDRRFLTKLFPEVADRKWLCTMRHILWSYESVSARTLEAISEHYGIRRSKPHRAASDAIVLLSVLRRENCIGVTHAKQLHDRAHRAPLTIQFFSASTGRLRKVVLAEVDDEELVRCAPGTRINLWTSDGYGYINGYKRGTVGGRGKVLSMEKSRNPAVGMLLRSGHDVELTLSSVTGTDFTFEMSARSSPQARSPSDA